MSIRLLLALLLVSLTTLSFAGAEDGYVQCAPQYHHGRMEPVSIDQHNINDCLKISGIYEKSGNNPMVLAIYSSGPHYGFISYKFCAQYWSCIDWDGNISGWSWNFSTRTNSLALDNGFAICHGNKLDLIAMEGGKMLTRFQIETSNDGSLKYSWCGHTYSSLKKKVVQDHKF
jgi:hypothetical protein